MKPALLTLLSWGVATWLCAPALAQSDASDDFKYNTNPLKTRSLGRDLQRALKPQYQEVAFGDPIAVEIDDLPFVRLEEVPEDPKPLPKVVISEGFDDLVNRVAHAKAIDKIQKGYFQKYILSLAEESGERELKPLPNDTDKRYWTEEMKNEQYSNYNSIVGTLVGINLAHFYLGHFKKYQSKLVNAEGKHAPINNLLTPKEWDESLRLGVRNALSAGCAIEGVLPFFECFEKMPKRPAWTAFFVPDNAKYKDTKKTLEKIQKDFFSGKND
ncbi:MAG: hypothetical protein HYY23_00140 [Verrucomicrobia bacterium]|nr:hypothetical protein [Verrucomicrobiota bacterium]